MVRLDRSRRPFGFVLVLVRRLVEAAAVTSQVGQVHPHAGMGGDRKTSESVNWLLACCHLQVKPFL